MVSSLFCYRAKCPICQLFFLDDEALNIHIEAKHDLDKEMFINDVMKLRKEEKQHYECIVCKNDHKTIVKFDSIIQLLPHLAMDHFEV